MDDQRLGAIVRAVRRRRHLRQIDVAGRAGVAQVTVSRLERGHLDALALRTVRAILAELDIRLALAPSWRGPDLDRLMDEDHSQLVGVVVAILEQHGWHTAIEVTYSHYGERGSIDILAVHPESRVALVVEVKSQLVSIEETARRLDQKTRLARAICAERFGWQPIRVGRLLVLPESSAERRRWERHRSVLDRLFPQFGGRLVRAWLSRPADAFSGVWFLSSSHGRTAKSIRRPRSAQSTAPPRTARDRPGA